MSARDDWLVGGDRRSVASERIYAAATDLIARDGPDALDIDTLAKRIHCSRATVYRHAGGKAEIRDAVLARAALRIVDSVRESVEDLTGPERVVTAITAALERIRSDPLGQLLINSIRGAQGTTWLAGSPLLADFARDLGGLADRDSEAAHWVVRVVLSLLLWPTGDRHTEREMLERFVAPAFSEHGRGPLR
jgi:AcrR family transcriptional regulator